MQWTVEGADKHTGRNRVVSIDADTQADAEQMARRQGILVSDCHPSLTTRSSTHVAAAGDEMDVSDAPPRSAPPVTSSNSTSSNSGAPRMEKRRRVVVPTYNGLAFGAGAFRIIATLLIMAALLCLVGAARGGLPLIDPMPRTYWLLYFCGYSIGACILYALGTACEALRDVAHKMYEL